MEELDFEFAFHVFVNKDGVHWEYQIQAPSIVHEYFIPSSEEEAEKFVELSLLVNSKILQAHKDAEAKVKTSTGVELVSLPKVYAYLLEEIERDFLEPECHEAYRYVFNNVLIGLRIMIEFVFSNEAPVRNPLERIRLSEATVIPFKESYSLLYLLLMGAREGVLDEFGGSEGSN